MSDDLLDLKYVNRDGDTMSGPLALSGDPILDAHAASKRYVDTVLANLRSLAMMRDGLLPMTGPLTLSGPPTSPLHASSRDYVDNVVAGAVAPLATVVYVDAQDALERIYADALDAAMRIYVDAQDVIDRAYADALDVAVRIYIDAADALMVRIDGSTPITGTLTLQSGLVAPLDTFADGDATPDVSAGINFITANTAPTTITQFDNGVDGKVISIIAGDNNTTIESLANIRHNGGADRVMAEFDCANFKHNGALWVGAGYEQNSGP